MSTAAELPSPTLPVARCDLRAVPLELRGQRYWTVKDPVALRYYQLRDEEHFLLELLDGQHSLEEVVQRFEARFAPRRLERSELARFLLLLHREGLVVAPAAGQGAVLLTRRKQRSGRRLLATLTNVLAIRLGGVNPDRLLSTVVPALRPLFSRWMLILVTALIALVAILVASHFGTLTARLPRLHEFLGPGNLVWLLVALALVKSLHELGHAVACKHFGGECNRIGVMLLVFTPALYCDVSDAWMFPNRWQRIAVSAAGVGVEIVLASLAALLWIATQPGWLNAMCLNVMVVCSVGTLLINGNPLLKYDGYYVLADLLEAPNLRQQASSALRRWSARLLAGIELDRPRLVAEPGPALLATYGVASLLYRSLLIVAILWLLHTALKPLGLAIVSHMLTVLILASLAYEPASSAWRTFSNPATRARLRPRRLAVAALLLAVLFAALLAAPLPSRVTAPIVLRPAAARPVYVTTPGVLESAAADGQQVEAGQLIGKLHNRKVEREFAALTQRLRQQQLHVQHLELRRHDVPTLGDQLPAAAKMLADLETQHAHQEQELARLTLYAPASGIVLPPPAVPAHSSSRELPTYSGTPLDEENRGCQLASGTLLCQIGDPQRLEAVAIVDQSDIERLRGEQRVKLRVFAAPRTALTGRVIDIARIQTDELPPELLAADLLVVERRISGPPRPLRTYYQAVIALDAPVQAVPINAVGRARISVDRQPLGLYLYRIARSTFRLPW